MGKLSLDVLKAMKEMKEKKIAVGVDDGGGA